jgi:hypothetical protein
VPVAVGFGISTPAQAAAVGRRADGVIVGTRLVRAVAEAGERERAEARVPAGADQQLHAVARVGHALDGQRRRRQALHELARGGLDRRRAVEAQHDAAGVGLVERPERLDDERAADPRGRGGGLGGLLGGLLGGAGAGQSGGGPSGGIGDLLGGLLGQGRR